MNKNYIKVDLPKNVSFVSYLQLANSLLNHSSIDNIQIVYGSFTTTKSKNQKSRRPIAQSSLRKKYQEIGRMLDSFEKGEPDD